MLVQNYVLSNNYSISSHYINKQYLKIEIESIIFSSDKSVNNDFRGLLYKVKKTICNIFYLLINGYEGCSFDELYFALRIFYQCKLSRKTIWRRLSLLIKYDYINNTHFLTIKFYMTFNVKKFIIH
ncbi:hypothetical protein C5F64_03290 [Photobacterium damselae subsp. damselae]|nr:hypothetical protein C5F64_03290 [Photobacterium damselae subsp. damselae]